MNNVTELRSRKGMKQIAIKRIAAGPEADPAPTPQNADVTRAVENLMTSFEAFKQENDARLQAVETGRRDVVQDEKVDRINDAVSSMQANLDALGDQMQAAIVAGAAAPDANGETAAQRTNREAFRAFVRGKISQQEYNATVKPEAVQAAGSTDSDPDGGFLVPDGSEAAITRIQGTMSSMRAISKVITIAGGTHTIPKSLGGASSGWVGERSSRSETNTPTISEIKIPTHEIYARPFATQRLLDDSGMNIEQWYNGEVGIEFDEKEGDAFVNGNGVEKPKGFLAETKVANASWAWGKLGFVVSGAAATINDSDEILDLIYGLKPAYRAAARFIMNDATTAIVRKLKDVDGNYIWQPGLQAGEPAQLAGYPVTHDDNMPDVGANNFPLAFGDFRRGYTVVDRMGVRVLRDPYSNKPYVEFYTTKRVGGGTSDFQAIKLMKCST